MANPVARGIKGGTITDLDAMEAVIRQSVHMAENMALKIMKGYPLREIIVAVPGVHAVSHAKRVEIDISGHEVIDQDIRNALAHAQEEMRQPASELIHTIGVNVAIDGHEGIREPRGMLGHRLDLDIHLVTGDQAALRNLAQGVGRSHLDVSAFCLSSYAAGLAVLVDDERDLGSIVIDMGAGLTSFAVFQNGAMIFADAVPVGGNHVTSDIANGLSTSLEDAERIKCMYGSALAAATDLTDLIDVPRVGESERRAPNHVSRSVLVGIIQPRLEEIFDLIRSRLADSGIEHIHSRRIVLTGGASQMVGMRDLVTHMMGASARLGRPIRVSGLPEMASGPAFSAVCGLLTYRAERASEIPAGIQLDATPRDLWGRIKHWLKENW
jgi:cell division protein FtsA